MSINVDHGNEIREYVQQADPTYAWECLRADRIQSGVLFSLRLISQTWQGCPWTHRLDLFVPDTLEFPERALLTIGSDAPGWGSPTHLDFTLARQIGMASAWLYDVPNQPLFEGLREDELLAFSLTQYLDTEDPTWPLLFPMVKSAVRALDTIQAACVQEGFPAPQQFAVHGASKRGWTTWLSAVVDSRVAAIMPEVYDNLNLFAQMPHQVEVWETYSEMIEDYTEARLQDKMRTPRGRQLALTIDPYTYRDHLTLPKLLINGANDRYWATDALNLYWDDLVGAKYILYAPNHGHHILDRQRLARTKRAFLHSVATNQALPPFHWDFEETKGALHVTLGVDSPAGEARVWVAASSNQDFRESHWEPRSLRKEQDRMRFSSEIVRPRSGNLAVIGEITLGTGESAYTLSTQVRILNSSL